MLRKLGITFFCMLLSAGLMASLAAAGQTQAGGGLSGILPAIENNEANLQVFAAEASEENTQILLSAGTAGLSELQSAMPDMAQDGLLFDNRGNGQKQPEQQGSNERPFTLTRIWDYDTGATLGRCYAPSDFFVNTYLFSAGDGFSECSAATPMQLGLLVNSPDGNSTMIYKSRMSYLYPPPADYVEGQSFKGRETMLVNMNALEYADHTILKISNLTSDVYRIKTSYRTDEEDSFLAEQSQYYMDYMNGGSLWGIGCDEVFSSWADVTYQYEMNGKPMKGRVITQTSQLRFVVYGYAVGVLDYETYVPYTYVLSAPEEQFDSLQEIFELFVSNTRVTDEFIILNMLRSQDMISILDTGFPQYDNLDEMAPSILGDDYGSYDTENFCDYILDQNDYTTSDGRSFKVPTSYDYVYEGDDGTIYATNTTEQPAGSRRLYAN